MILLMISLSMLPVTALPACAPAPPAPPTSPRPEAGGRGGTLPASAAAPSASNIVRRVIGMLRGLYRIGARGRKWQGVALVQLASKKRQRASVLCFRQDARA